MATFNPQDTPSKGYQNLNNNSHFDQISGSGSKVSENIYESPATQIPKE